MLEQEGVGPRGNEQKNKKDLSYNTSYRMHAEIRSLCVISVGSGIMADIQIHICMAKKKSLYLHMTRTDVDGRDTEKHDV